MDVKWDAESACGSIMGNTYLECQREPEYGYPPMSLLVSQLTLSAGNAIASVTHNSPDK